MSLQRMAVCHTLPGVSPTHRYTFWIDDAQEAALKELIERPGEESAVSFHLRQAIREVFGAEGRHDEGGAQAGCNPQAPLTARPGVSRPNGC